MHWIYPSIGSAIFGFGLGSISDVALTLVIDSYRAVSSSCLGRHPLRFADMPLFQITGEAFVAIAFIRNIASIAMVFAIVPWIDAQGLQNMYIVDAVWAFVMACLHIPLIIWGKKIRQHTAGLYEELALRKGSDRF